jgi:hypothetical protein
MITQIQNTYFIASPVKRGGYRIECLQLDYVWSGMDAMQTDMVEAFGGHWVKDIFYPKSPLPEVELPVKRYPPDYYNC